MHQHPTCEMSKKVHDVDLKQPIPTSGVESMRGGAVPPKLNEYVECREVKLTHPSIFEN